MSKKKYFFYSKLILCLLILSLQLSKDFIHLRFATSPVNFVIKRTSYLSSLSVGYGNYFPLLTFLLTLMVFLRLLFSMGKEKFSLILILLAALGNLLPIGMGMTQINKGIVLIELIYLLLLLLLWKDGNRV